MIPDRKKRILSFWKSALVLLFVFSPALYTGMLVWEKSVDIACWDTWENAPLLQKWHDGTLTWHDLYAPQIQHRIVVPRLIILTLSHLSGGDFRWENYFTYLVFLGSGLLVWRLLRRTLGRDLWVGVLAFACNLLIFTPMTFQVLFWGAAMWMALPVLFFLGILNLATPNLTARNPGLLSPRSPASSWLLFGGMLLLTLAATHSFSHGLVFWPVILVFLLLLGSLASFKTRLIYGGIWIGIATITIYCYFSNFYNVAFHAYNLKPGDYALEGGISLDSVENLKKFAGFFFGFLGNPFARTPFEDYPLTRAEPIGIVIFGLFVLVASLIVFTKTGRKTWPQSLPWLALAAYVIGVALAISKGRAHLGEHRSTTTRYLVVSVYLPVCTMVLAALQSRAWLQWLKDHPGNKIAQRLPAQAPGLVAAVLLTGFCVAQIPSWQYSLHLTEIWHRARLQSKALVLFLPHFALNRDEMNVLCKDYEYCLDAVNALQQMHLIKTKVLETPELRWFSREKKPLPKEKAEILSAAFSADGGLQIRGHARFGATHPSDLLLLAHGDRVVALLQPVTRHWLRIYGLDYEFSNVEDIPVQAQYPWAGQVKPGALPAGEVSLEVWALDVSQNRIARIGDTVKVDMTNRTVEIESTR